MNTALPTRAVIDTNALLDWLVFGDTDAIAVGLAVASGHLSWMVTPRVMAEWRWVLERPLDERWESARKHALTLPSDSMAKACAEPESMIHRLACRDASDQVFVDLAVAQAPCWLLTRDRALLALRRRAAGYGVRVATPAQWRGQMQGTQP